jgi:hypothetical protein
MPSIRRILVAVKDPSSKSLPAVTKAAQLARALGAELELFHSISTPLHVDAYPSTEPLSDIARAIRRKCLKDLEVVATSTLSAATLLTQFQRPLTTLTAPSSSCGQSHDLDSSVCSSAIRPRVSSINFHATW